MILCAHRAQLCRKIRLFCCISLFLRNFLFRMRLFAAGLSGWVGALWEGWQVCGARFPFFRGAMGTPRPCKRFAVFAAAGVCLVDCTPANGTPFPPYTGVQVCCTYAIRFFCPPCPAPDSRFPIADFYLRQLPAFKLSCVNCNPSRAILCGTYLIIKGGAALCKFATDLFEAAVSCCNFAQGIARILCRTFPERVGKTHRIALFPYAAYRWKTAQVTPGTVVILHRVFPLPCPAVTRVPVGKPHRIGPFPGVAIYTGLAVFGLFATLRRLLSAQESGGGMHRLVLVEHTGLRCYITQALPITNIELNI